MDCVRFDWVGLERIASTYAGSTCTGLDSIASDSNGLRRVGLDGARSHKYTNTVKAFSAS